MTEPRAFLAIDVGSASTSVALVGHMAGAWRLIGSLGVPTPAAPEAAVDVLLRRVLAVDPDLAGALGVADLTPGHAGIPRLQVQSARPRKLAVVAASDRTVAALLATADRSGWRTVSATVGSTDPLAMTRLLLDPTVDAVLAGAGDPPRPDERTALGELAALVAAVATRRPEVPVILSGGMAERLPAFGEVARRTGEVVLAPAAGGEPDGSGPLADLLLELALPPDDPRRRTGAAAQALADVLDRRVEAIVLGHDASTRVLATPSAGGVQNEPDVAVVPAAAVAPEEPDDAAVDGVLVWSTVPSDRHRLRDRLRELRIAPWADAAGDGAALRMAAARAAMGRLVAHTAGPTWSHAPDLVVTAGGVWSGVPAPTVALAVVDVVRRPGASQFALDHARLLGPLGSIPDRDERQAVLRDLADDLLAPLGSVVTPAGLRAGRSAGSLVVHAAGASTEVDLVPGGLELVDLAPGETAVAEFRFRETVRLGARGRHFAVDVGGGLAGLLIDLRDVPLRLPDRADRRRDLLSAWQTALWAGGER